MGKNMGNCKEHIAVRCGISQQSPGMDSYTPFGNKTPKRIIQKHPLPVSFYSSFALTESESILLSEQNTRSA